MDEEGHGCRNMESNRCGSPLGLFPRSLRVKRLLAASVEIVTGIIRDGHLPFYMNMPKQGTGHNKKTLPMKAMIVCGTKEKSSQSCQKGATQWRRKEKGTHFHSYGNGNSFDLASSQSSSCTACPGHQWLSKWVRMNPKEADFGGNSQTQQDLAGQVQGLGCSESPRAQLWMRATALEATELKFRSQSF